MHEIFFCRNFMTQSQLKLAALSMDLKRVALSYHTNSMQTGLRFAEESMKKVKRIERRDLPDYIQKLLERVETVLGQEDKQKVAEDALMYSTMLQNAALHNT